MVRGDRKDVNAGKEDVNSFEKNEPAEFLVF